MNILFIADIIQIIASVLLVILILIQSKGSLYSGVGSSIGFYRSRRGIEKAVFIFTIILIIVLVLNSVVLILFS